MGWTAASTFFLLAAFVQFGIGFAIIIRRPKVEWAIVLGAIFVANGAIATNSLLNSLLMGPWASVEMATRVFFYFDKLVILLIGYLAFSYPFRPRWAKRPWILPTIFLGLLFSLVIPHALGVEQIHFWPTGQGPPGCGNPCVTASWFHVWSYDVTAIGFSLLMVRWAYLLPRTKSPDGIGQFLLLFAAFVTRGIHVDLAIFGPLAVAYTTPPTPFWVGDARTWFPLVRTVLVFSAIASTFWLLFSGRSRLSTERRRVVDTAIGFALFGALEALLAWANPETGNQVHWFAFGILLNVDVLILRPILVVYAMLRYDLLGSWSTRRLPILVIAGMLSTFGYAAGLQTAIESLSGDPIVAWAIAIPLALALGATTTVLLQTYVAPPKNSNIRKYLALLEDAYRNGTPGPIRLSRLDWHRKQLGIDVEDADALQASVASAWQGDGLWLPGQKIGGRYELQRLLGTGGWGEVYLAKDLVDGPEVVLKRTRGLRLSEQKALLAEAYTMTRLASEHLVPLIRSEVIAGEPILVLEYMPGGSLASRLAVKKASAAELQEICRDTLRALWAVHSQGYIHGDIKPANLLFDRDGKLRLADFGLAHRQVTRPALGDPTPTRQPRGSTRYLAPEQVKGQAPTAASDLYSTGIVLLEALTGNHPIPAGIPEYEQQRRVAEGRIKVPTSAGAWRAFLNQLLDPNPLNRPTAKQALAQIPQP